MKIQVKLRRRNVEMPAPECVAKQVAATHNLPYQRLRSIFFSVIIAVIVLILAFSTAMATLVVLTRLSDRFIATKITPVRSDGQNGTTTTAPRLNVRRGKVI